MENKKFCNYTDDINLYLTVKKLPKAVENFLYVTSLKLPVPKS